MITFALLKQGVSPLANIARRPIKFATEQSRKVVAVAKTAVISNLGHALIAVAQHVPRFNQTQTVKVALRGQAGAMLQLAMQRAQR